jgi:hypothetical protein
LYRHRRSGTKPKSWFEHSEGQQLLQQQQLLVKAHYHGLTFQADSESGRMLLKGDFVLKADCGIPTTIRIRIRFPSNYPSSEPTAYDAGAFSQKMSTGTFFPPAHFAFGCRHVLPGTKPTRMAVFCDSWMK